MNGYSQSPSTHNRTLVNGNANTTINVSGSTTATNSYMNKPPPAPTPQAVSSQMTSRGGRSLMSYQRSATTSIVPTVQAKLNQIQKQQQQLQQLQQIQQMRAAALSRTSTNQSIASSSNASTISTTTSVSASSSMNQIQPSVVNNNNVPLNSSSPRSRNESPSFNTNNSNKIISPSGLLTDGPLGRRGINNNSSVGRSPHKDRDRSTSPSYVGNNLKASVNGSNSSLNAIHETKMGTKVRKSFLPQPVQQMDARKPSVSPVRHQQHLTHQQRNTSPSWKDGCY